MRAFILEEYQKMYQEKYKEKRNENSFFEFIKEKFGDEEIKNEYFSQLDANDLLQSLEYRIVNGKITARGTANRYIGALKKLYERLEKEYGITNGLYVNGDFTPEFTEIANKRISLLNEKTDKDIAIDEDYKRLVKKIEEFGEEFSYEKAIEGIDKFLYEKNDKSSELRMFRYACSVCSVQLVLECGLKSNVIIDIKLEDINLKNETINRNGYLLPLSSSLRKNLSNYLKVREYILEKTNRKQDRLFIDFAGDSYHEEGKTPVYENLFYILKDLFKSVQTDKFARRHLIRMVEHGLNGGLIGDITGYKGDVYKKVCETVNNDKESGQKKLDEIFSSMPSSEPLFTPKGYIICPECKKAVKAVSEELVLVKKKNDTTLYLACKKCGGYND